MSIAACDDSNSDSDDGSGGESNGGSGGTGAVGKGGSGGSTPCVPPAFERGTESCQRWHAALCAWASTCGTLDECDCLDQASAISCLSDSAATNCSTRLEALDCSVPPIGCDLTDLADPEPAEAACVLFIERICDSQERCSGTDPVACAEEASTLIDCTQAVGVKPSFEQCLGEIDALPCEATEIPESCAGAVLLAQ
jgi:hypothetical protein